MKIKDKLKKTEIQIINNNKSHNKNEKERIEYNMIFFKYQCDLISNFLYKRDRSLNDLEEMICKKNKFKKYIIK